MKNPHAVALGKRAKGIPKNFTDAELERRRKWAKGLAKIRKARKSN